MTWAEEAPKEAVIWSTHFIDDLRKVLLPRLLALWLISDEASAQDWAAKHLEADEAEQVDVHLKRSRERLEKEKWSAADHADFAEKIRAELREVRQVVQSGDLLADVLQDITRIEGEFKDALMGWGTKDPVAALKFLDSSGSELIPIFVSDQLRKEIIRMWARLDPDGALAHAQEMADDQGRIDALVEILPAWQIKHPDQALEELVDLDRFPEKNYEELVTRLLKDRTSENPTVAMDYANSLQDADLQAKAVRTVMKTWAEKSPDAAKEWVQTQSPGPVRDSALSILGRKIALTDLAVAGQLIQQIENPELKHASISSALYSDQVATQLPEALNLAAELPEISHDTLADLADRINPLDRTIFRHWVEVAQVGDRIQYTVTDLEQVPPGQWQEMKERNEQTRARQFQEILERIDQKAKE